MEEGKERREEREEKGDGAGLIKKLGLGNLISGVWFEFF